MLFAVWPFIGRPFVKRFALSYAMSCL